MRIPSQDCRPGAFAFAAEPTAAPDPEVYRQDQPDAVCRKSENRTSRPQTSHAAAISRVTVGRQRLTRSL